MIQNIEKELKKKFDHYRKSIAIETTSLRVELRLDGF